MATSTETRADIVADIRRRAPAWLDPVFTEIDLRLAERIEAADEYFRLMWLMAEHGGWRKRTTATA